jgi:DNA-binding response OmpR family regulator
VIMAVFRVLIVEDHEPNRVALSRIFARNGWEAVSVGTTAEGLAALDQQLDCVILDLNLPDGEGEAILRKVRREKLPVRVVAVVTGSTDSIRLGEVARLSPDLTVQKPLDWEILWRYCDSEIRRP